MKRFFVFAWEDPYPSGGIHDFIKDFDSEGEATAFANGWVQAKGGGAKFHVWDSFEEDIVREGHCEY